MLATNIKYEVYVEKHSGAIGVRAMHHLKFGNMYGNGLCSFGRCVCTPYLQNCEAAQYLTSSWSAAFCVVWKSKPRVQLTVTMLALLDNIGSQSFVWFCGNLLSSKGATHGEKANRLGQCCRETE